MLRYVGILISFLSITPRYGVYSETIFREDISILSAPAVVDGRIDQQEVGIIVDTGAELSAIDGELEKNGTVGVGIANIRDIHEQKISARQVDIECLNFGDHVFRNIEAVSFDFSPLRQMYGDRIRGIIGFNELGKGKLFLNFSQKAIELHTDDWRIDNGDYHEARLFHRKPRLPYIETSFFGSKRSFLIDTGFDGTIQLPAELFDELVEAGRIELRRTPMRIMGGTGVIESVRSGWLLEGSLMGKDLTGIPVDTAQEAKLGLEWLFGFDVELDMAAGKIRYRLINDPTPPIDWRLMLGARLSFHAEGARLESLKPGGGAAENAGLKVGDLIVEFGELSAKQMSNGTLATIVEQAAGGTLSLRVKKASDELPVIVELELPDAVSKWEFPGRGSL
jgi:hypothetical protein